MKVAAIDIGTSKICGMVIDEQKQPLTIIKRANDSAINDNGVNGNAEKEQNPEIILQICKDIYYELKTKYPDIVALGLTGQMHGIVYVDKNGNSVSPLYTWQDRRGNYFREGTLTYAEDLSKKTGYRCISGHGLVTHSWFVHKNMVPVNAVKICTIAAYVAMHLTSNTSPIMHKSDADSFDVYDLKNARFDNDAILKAGLSPDILPTIYQEESVIGETKEGVKIIVPIGDNQASIIGAMCTETAPLINLGTGGQISIITSREASTIKNVDVRPFVDGKNLIVGISLCGGYSYTVLKRFFEETAKMLEVIPPENIFDLMEKAASNIDLSDCIHAETAFLGTYDDPETRASYQHISDANFTPGHMTYATLKGMCRELFDIYKRRILPNISVNPNKIIGAGNCVRSVSLIKSIIEDMFELPLQINEQKEEAVYGAALLALSKVKN